MMRMRKMRVLALLAMGYSFQVLGCQSQELGDFIAETIKEGAVGVSSIVVGAAVDELLGLTE